MTDHYAVFGNPVAHSKSPLIHALFARQTGQDLRYDALLAPLDGFEQAIRAFIAGGGCGANVTVPFKEQAFRLATQLTTRAKAAGAVNTLIFVAEDGPVGDVTRSLDEGTGGKVHIVGDNTDGAGLVGDITNNLGFAIAGKRVLLLGAGGAARGVTLPLLDELPASLTIANRTADRARLLVDRFAAEAHGVLGGGSFEQLSGCSFDLVINATSAGLENAELPLPAGVFAQGCLAYEMLYGRDTPFLRQARRANANLADGLGMLVEQAAEAFFVWRGIRPETTAVLLALRNS